MYSPQEKGLVYFVSADNAIVKIGVTKKCALKRMAGLQSAYPHKLHLVGVTRGGPDGEKFWHQYFDKYRLLGEWFDFANFDIEKFLCECKDLKGMPSFVRRSLPVKIGLCTCWDCTVPDTKQTICKYCRCPTENTNSCKKCRLKRAIWHVTSEHGWRVW